VAIDITHQLYYADVMDPTLRDSDQLETLNNKAMDVFHKEHMIIFHKQIPYAILHWAQSSYMRFKFVMI